MTFVVMTNVSNYRYVFGITHVPRLEDWPVMPVEHIGFMLQVCLLESHIYIGLMVAC